MIRYAGNHISCCSGDISSMGNEETYKKSLIKQKIQVVVGGEIWRGSLSVSHQSQLNLTDSDSSKEEACPYWPPSPPREDSQVKIKEKKKETDRLCIEYH